jgi:hypothetical protein
MFFRTYFASLVSSRTFNSGAGAVPLRQPRPSRDEEILLVSIEKAFRHKSGDTPGTPAAPYSFASLVNITAGKKRQYCTSRSYLFILDALRMWSLTCSPDHHRSLTRKKGTSVPTCGTRNLKKTHPSPQRRGLRQLINPLYDPIPPPR